MTQEELNQISEQLSSVLTPKNLKQVVEVLKEYVTSALSVTNQSENMFKQAIVNHRNSKDTVAKIYHSEEDKLGRDRVTPEERNLGVSMMTEGRSARNNPANLKIKSE